MIDAVAAVVPAHDEQERIGSCLEAVLAAAEPLRARGVRVVVAVGLDACGDRTRDCALAALAPLPPFDRLLVDLDLRAVGATRRAATAAALDALGGAPADRVWLAHTDADTVVAGDWLERQVAFAEQGWLAVAGSLTVGDWTEQPRSVRDSYSALLRSRELPGLRHTHVYGANLGLRADAYLAAGGFADVTRDEEWRLVEQLEASGVDVLRTREVLVRTSARRHGRAPGGLADLLGRLRVAAGAE